jgi:PBP1b-binding outer membrane lipoprotein LpoB
MSARKEYVRIAMALGLACSLVGCRSLFKKDAPPAEEVDAAQAPQAAAADESAIPASQDFEEEAQEKVTSANFKAELARIKKEISGK